MKIYNNILLVDDDLDACFLNKRTIHSMQLADNIVTCCHGKEALSFLSDNCMHAIGHTKQCPDLIFLDIKMPVMDGFEFLEEFIHLPIKTPRPKVFILTSSNHKTDYERATEFKVDGYIVKPLTRDKVISALNA